MKLRVLLVTLLALSGCMGTGASGKPNILIIVGDDLGEMLVGAYGQRTIKTPFIDHLAANGFQGHGLSAAPTCKPSRESLMTGLHLNNTTFKRLSPPTNEEDIPESEVTIAEVLKKSGYATGGFGKWGLGTKEGAPQNQGFDYWHGTLTHRQAIFKWLAEIFDSNTGTATPLEPGEYSSDVVVNRAVTWMLSQSGPWYAYVASQDPHWILEPPANYVTPYVGLPYVTTTIGGFEHQDGLKKFAGSVTAFDDQVRRLVQAAGPNTLIIITGDNGAQCTNGMRGIFTYFGAGKGMRGCKTQLYQGGLRVPFIAYWPGHIQPRRNAEWIAGYDIAPTVAEAAGASMPTADGISVLPLLLGDVDALPHRRLVFGQGDNRAYINTKTSRKRIVFANGRVEQYDLYEDPGETRNLNLPNRNQTG